VVLFAILVGNLGVITYAWLHGGGTPQKRVLVVLWVLAAVAALFLGPLYAALNRSASTSSGANLDDNVGPSNKRWRDP
jgi:ribose/xylose/arabinose/galactoside ABC-type transport system permease subunit